MSATQPYPKDSTAPVASGATITPADSTPISPAPCRGLWIGGAGDVAVTFAQDAIGASGVVIKAVPAGTLLAFAVKVVWSTGTTATNIVALY